MHINTAPWQPVSTLSAMRRFDLIHKRRAQNIHHCSFIIAIALKSDSSPSPPFQPPLPTSKPSDNLWHPSYPHTSRASIAGTSTYREQTATSSWTSSTYRSHYHSSQQGEQPVLSLSLLFVAVGAARGFCHRRHSGGRSSSAGREPYRLHQSGSISSSGTRVARGCRSTIGACGVSRVTLTPFPCTGQPGGKSLVIVKRVDKVLPRVHWTGPSVIKLQFHIDGAV